MQTRMSSGTLPQLLLHISSFSKLMVFTDINNILSGAGRCTIFVMRLCHCSENIYIKAVVIAKVGFVRIQSRRLYN